MADYEALYADVDRMKNHWWWRPGWQVGTRFYAWHVTLDGQGDLHRLVDDIQHALADVPTLDPVPRRWRHITMTGMGHVRDVPDDLRDAAIENVRAAVQGLGPIDTTFQHVSIFAEAVAVRPVNPDAFTVLQNAAQRATADVIPGADQHNPRFRAHVTAHYSHDDGDPDALRHRLNALRPAPAQARFTQLDLIRMHRDRHMYEWEVVDSVAL